MSRLGGRRRADSGEGDAQDRGKETARLESRRRAGSEEGDGQIRGKEMSRIGEGDGQTRE